MKRKNAIIAALVLILVVGASIGGALAYFTTSTEAEGEQTVNPYVRTDLIEDRVENWTKYLTVRADDKSGPVYVRIGAFYDSGLVLEDSGEGWTRDGDWFYYGPILNGGESSAELQLHIENIPADAGAVNVAIVHEYKPVTYDAEGNPLEPVWD